MLKNGIFVKIYLCFWLTIILVLTTQIVLDRVDDSSPFNRMKHHIDSSLALYGQAALAYHIAGNSQAVVSLTDQFKATNGLEAYIVDEEFKKLDGSFASPNIRDLASQAFRNDTNEHFRGDSLDLLAIPIHVPNMKRYVVIGSFDHRRLMSPPPHSGSSNLAIRISIVLFISGLVCYLLARYLVAPLIVLRDVATRFAAGEHSVRVGSRIGSRKDETTELANDFDKMAERIESLMKLQRQLIGDISHELRSPLARLNVALDLARQNTGAEAEHALNRIEEEALELNEMIGELLTLTRLESGNEQIDTAQVNISDIVRDIVGDADFETQGSNRGVKLLNCDDCLVIGNNDLLKRAIENVVRNAIHYTDVNTDVEVSIKRLNPDKVEVFVRDHGSGVPEAELGNIFRPFYRTSESRERQTGGTGLGLAISERAVHLHHGTIVAKNTVGCGLSVYISLPLKPDR
jgi:two-component system sensor histidine kinase CpxA